MEKKYTKYMFFQVFHKYILTLFLIGFIGVSLNLNANIIDQGLEDDLVFVEANYIDSDKQNMEYKLIPYGERREDNGLSFSIFSSQFDPNDYQPKFSVNTFEQVYGVKNGTGIGVSFSVKNHYSFMTFSYDFGVSFYSVESLASADDVSTLKVTPLHFGAKISFETLMNEPYFVPFIGGGIYIAQYEEQQNNNPTFKGNTQPAGYFHLGGLIQLDWLDRDTAKNAFVESGLQNTFLFFEGKSFLASSNAVDPSFATDVQLNAGLQLEF